MTGLTVPASMKFVRSTTRRTCPPATPHRHARPLHRARQEAHALDRGVFVAVQGLSLKTRFRGHSWPKRRSDDRLNHRERSQPPNEKRLQMSSFRGGTRNSARLHKRTFGWGRIGPKCDRNSVGEVTKTSRLPAASTLNAKAACDYTAPGHGALRPTLALSRHRGNRQGERDGDEAAPQPRVAFGAGGIGPITAHGGVVVSRDDE